MDKIKATINDIVTYKCDTFESIKVQYETMGNRINEGLVKMKESGVFSDSEIQEISTFAYALRKDRYLEAKNALTEKMRESFEF